MKSMTYGMLPTYEEFEAAFDREYPSGYNIQLNSMDSAACEGFKLGDGCWTCESLWSCIQEIVKSWGEPDTTPEEYIKKEQAMDLVSSIMFTLEFEWI